MEIEIVKNKNKLIEKDILMATRDDLGTRLYIIIHNKKAIYNNWKF